MGRIAIDPAPEAPSGRGGAASQVHDGMPGRAGSHMKALRP